MLYLWNHGEFLLLVGQAGRSIAVFKLTFFFLKDVIVNFRSLRIVFLRD